MAKKKRSGSNLRRVRGIPGRALAERERRLVEQKERELRAVINRLHALQRDDAAKNDAKLDECFRQVRQLAASPKGLVSDAFRQELWPFLLNVSTIEDSALGRPPIDNTSSTEKAHRDAAQVEKDVERSLWHYDVVLGIKESDRRAKRRALTQIITGVLQANAELYYFQGYHDIVSVFLLTLEDPQCALRTMQHVSESYHREPMRSGFESVMATTRLLFPLLDAADEALFGHLRESHVVLEAQTKILHCERDFGTMHGLLSKLPLTMDIEKVLARAVVLFQQLPPTQLRQRSQLETVETPNMYFQFPFEYQPWPSVTTPLLNEVPPLPPRRTSGDKTGIWVLGSWQTSIVVTAAVIGVVAVVSAYYLRDRTGVES